MEISSNSRFSSSLNAVAISASKVFWLRFCLIRPRAAIDVPPALIGDSADSTLALRATYEYAFGFATGAWPPSLPGTRCSQHHEVLADDGLAVEVLAHAREVGFVVDGVQSTRHEVVQHEQAHAGFGRHAACILRGRVRADDVVPHALGVVCVRAVRNHALER